jgi:hypothetical protein
MTLSMGYFLLRYRFPYVQLPDERLGKPFEAIPPIEDMYIYQNNGPTFEGAWVMAIWFGL